MPDPIFRAPGERPTALWLTPQGRLAGRCSDLPCDPCGPVACAFYHYEPCVLTPFYDCPTPENVYVTTCWRCTSGSGSQTIIDPSGYCWTRVGTQPFLPDPGTGEPPPAGFEWIPEGATVWDQVEGPCANGCVDPACRTFDQFIPATKCPCSTGPGPAVKYFRCDDVIGRTGCLVASGGGGDCYQLDRTAPSVPGPIAPGLILGVPDFDSCCACCDTQPGSPCESGLFSVRNWEGCPITGPARVTSVPTCCEAGSVFQMGYAIVLEAINEACPDVLEHWWFRDEAGGWLRWRYRRYDGQCTETEQTGELARGDIDCTTPLVWDMLPGAPNPTTAGTYCGTGECADTFLLRESAAGGRFNATAYFPPFPGDPCDLAFQVSAAVVRVSTGATCASECAVFAPGDPVIPPPPGGGNSPGALGFRVARTRRGPVVWHPALPGVIGPRPSLQLARHSVRGGGANVRRAGGCSGCGSDGGL